MELLDHLSETDRQRVLARLNSNLMVWLTTVRPDGQPVTVPVWFLAREDGTIVVYSRANKAKLANIAANPKVSLGLDVTDIGRNIVRLEGVARHDPSLPRAHEHPAFLAKYVERMGAMFDTPENFGELFTAGLVIEPTKVYVG
ncbi:pyridoxamine 5'-phosphate oxidase family protein [Catenulispora pinisilvae]|uniref:pyridoxamine 5'-phosphate oxidase family protein n=1 Tax=Catenulispora pinisilvae TaxID=2705253 RepID=UPI001891EFE8|nr:pyridoxamine 5'-phosphate oxidase family protein [Catenulispora pinisilvae]